MTNELKLREAAERVRAVQKGDSLHAVYPHEQFGHVYSTPLIAHIRDKEKLIKHALATLAAREGEGKLFKEAAWFCNEAIKSCDCTSTERIQYEETRDDFLGRLAKALGISTKENNT